MDRELAGVVVGRLAAAGWTVRDLQQPLVPTLTRPVGDGVLLAVQLLPDVVSFSRHPGEHRLRVGAGSGPALDLMPLLTLPARPILTGDADLVLGADPDAGPAADRIVAAVAERAADLATRFPDTAALAAAVSGRKRLVLLAALGRAEEVRAQLAAEQKEEEPVGDGAAGDGPAGDGPAGEGPTREGPAGEGPADRRFHRQLTRRLDQGLPPAPPVERTLAVIVPAGEPWPGGRTLMATARARSRTQKAAYQAARRRAAGRSREEIGALLVAESRARGLDPQPSEVLMRAEVIELRQRPLGTPRAAVAVAALLLGGLRDVVRMFRSGRPWTAEADPAWLRPPDRAGYPVPVTSRHVEVRLDPVGRGRLAQAEAQAARRIGPAVMLDAWLTRGPAGRVTVHVGRHPVGTVDDDGSYDLAFTAAALFDEDPVLTARLLPYPLLELPVPRAAPAG